MTKTAISIAFVLIMMGCNFRKEDSSANKESSTTENSASTANRGEATRNYVEMTDKELERMASHRSKGETLQLKLTDEDLNESYRYGDNETLEEYLKVELIDEQTFDDKLASKVDYFEADTFRFSKMDHVITLNSYEKDVVLTDKPTSSDDEIYHTYVGQYPDLNQYVVHKTGWEWWGYSFYDKVTGEEQPVESVFRAFPHLSPNKKHLFFISHNYYEDTSEIGLFEVTEERKMEEIISGAYPRWVPVDEDAMFWAQDDCFYLKSIHAESVTMEDAEYQYLRIHLLQ